VPTFMGNPREQAEQLVAAARKAGDRRAEAAAMIDLGVALMRGGDMQRAGETLAEALTTARNFGDRLREYDALNNLSLVLLGGGQPMRALEPLGQALSYARETKDSFKLKLTLSNAATILAAMRDYGEALSATDQALTLARELDDRHHEADLLWFQAIVQAELGQRDKACVVAQAAIDIHAALRSPHVAWLADHLKRFRESAPALTAPTPSGGYYTGASTIMEPMSARESGSCDPGLLRTAQRAVKAMADTTGTGLKTVAPPEYQMRLDTCAACPHHTGARCLLTGAFTRAKAWLPYEKCPIGKWPK
jgi:tetratricopeptide (TPR) repeat protein